MTTLVDEKDLGPPREDKLQIIRGLPLSTMMEKEIIEEILEFMPEDDDIIIATYPKTGTTWMQYIVHQILTKGESFPSFNDILKKVVPFLEMFGVSSLKQLTTRPRVYKTHIPYDMLKKNPKSKVIYVYRKPEDTLVSYYHFLKNLNLLVQFDKFTDDFLGGNISFGSYFKHVLSFLEHKNDENLLFVAYEKLHDNTKDEILKVAEFLGVKHYNLLKKDKTVLDNILKHSSFDYMKTNLSWIIPVGNQTASEDSLGEIIRMREVLFFRKGKVGEGKKTLKESQIKQLQIAAKEILKGTDILLEWYPE